MRESPVPSGRRALLRFLARKACALGRRGRPREAARAVERMLAAEPACAWALLYRAGLRLAAGDAGGAEADCARLDGTPPDRVLLCGDLQTPPPDRFPGLATALKEFLRKRPRLPWGFVLSALHARAAGRWEQGRRDIDRALALRPENAAFWALAARVRYVSRLPREGEAAMDRAARLAPRAAWIAAWKGESLRHAARFSEAERWLTRAILLDPGYTVAYSWRGGARRMLGRYRDARKDLDLALRLEFDLERPFTLEAFPDEVLSRAWAEHERSIVRRALGDYLGAVRDLNAAHRRNSRHEWLGDPRRPQRQERWQSLELLDAAAARHPGSAWLRAWRGFSRGRLGLTAEGLSDLDAAIRLDPKLAWAYAWRAALSAAGPRAEADLSRSIVLDPGYGAAYLWRGKLRAGRGRWRAAEKDLARACALDPVCAQAWAERGRAAARRGRRKDARAFLDEALTLDPGFDQARQWRERL